MALDLSPVKGTNDYLPEEQVTREWIADTLKGVFKLYGYRPIETSILDYWEVGASKYAGGEEILKETYKLTDQGKRELMLRYELTFKLAKLMGANPNMRQPFKRYEIGKVFRDGPVKMGRLREFTQCDVDVVGSKSMVLDAEIIKMVFDVFSRLGMDVYVQVNSKKIQFGLFSACGIKENDFVPAALSLDKLVKFGKKVVVEEMEEKGIPKKSIAKLFEVLEEIESLPNEKRLQKIKVVIKDDKQGQEGIKEMEEFLAYCKQFGIAGGKDLIFQPSLARGLGYYTGMVWEVYLKDKDSKITSSLSAGGRWDDMIGKFLGSKAEYPATGITFGLDVIYAAIKEKEGKGPSVEGIAVPKTPSVYIIPIDTLAECLNIASQLRSNGVSCDVAFDKKLGKAMDYANKEGIPYIIVIGGDEIKSGKVKVKDMKTGEEKSAAIDQVYKVVHK